MARLEDMETFIKVVEAGSLTGAAERLGVAKSVVSRRIADLEARLGAQLFRRTTRRLNLTDTAATFYDRCVRILADVQEAEDAAADEHGTLRGGIRVAMPLSFGLMHLGPAVDEFMELHPEVSFDLDFNDREVDLLAEGFDVALRIGRLADSSFIARRIASIEIVASASPGYLERRGTPQHPRDLTGHDCLTYTNLPDPGLWTFAGPDGKPVSVRVGARLAANNGNFLRDAAIAGQGIVLQPTFICYEAIEAAELVPILDGYRGVGVNAYAIYPQTRHLSRRVRAFVDFLAERFAGVPYWDLALESGG